MVSIGKAERALFGAYLQLDCGPIGSWIVTECILGFASGVDDNVVRLNVWVKGGALGLKKLNSTSELIQRHQGGSPNGTYLFSRPVPPAEFTHLLRTAL
jgi:hypothetical protein